MCGKKPRREEISVEGDRKWQGRRPGVMAGNPQAICVQCIKDLIQRKTGQRAKQNRVKHHSTPI